MNYDSNDYETIRQRVERRLEPMKKLRRLRLWFFVDLGLYIGLMSFITRSKGTTVFYYTTTDSVGDIAYHMQPWLYFFIGIWLCLLFAHLVHVWSAYRHERAIQRETAREYALEIERLRLEVELAKGKRGGLVDDEYPAEKAKRGIQLSDDGELIPDEEAQVSVRSRR